MTSPTFKEICLTVPFALMLLKNPKSALAVVTCSVEDVLMIGQKKTSNQSMI